MIRLILAIGVAGALWPVDDQDSALSMPPKRPDFEFSSTQMLSAAYSVFEDVGQFCDRNIETCVTGKQAFDTVYSKVQSQFAKPTNSTEEPVSSSEITQ